MIRAARIAVALLLLGTAAGAGDTGGLEQRAQRFYDLLAHGNRSAAEAAFPALERDLAAATDSLQDRLDAMREDVIDRDGDLEALYESPAWRESEIASLVLAYHLAWVRYQGAQLTSDATRKKALLRSAAQGFGQFTVVSEVPEIYAESLYGRGLAFMDLGQYRDAIADLQAASELPKTRTKAKAALAEAKRRAAGGKPVTAPTPEEQLARLRTLVEAAARDPEKGAAATELARGLAAQGGEWPGKVRGVVTDTLGGDPPKSSYGLALLGQLAVDARRCQDLPALVQAGADVRDAGRARWRPELLFLTAACVLNAGKAAEAARLLGDLETEFPKSPRAEEASYYRARALDTARHDDPALGGAYEQALRRYLDRFPKSTRATEIRFLLAERLREEGKCAEAAPLYAQVTEGELAPRARLATLECRVGALPPDDAAARARLQQELAAFVADPPKGADERTRAKATLLAALLAARAKPPDDAAIVALLAGYERRFPEEKEWHQSALRARLEARVRAGETGDAEADLQALLADAKDDPEARSLAAQLGRDLMERAGSEPGAAALARQIWEALAADGTNVQDRVTLGELELESGDAAAARATFEAVLVGHPDSAQARRGLARAAAAVGDRDASMAAWREVVEHSKPGGTAWYEARLAQFELLAGGGDEAAACDLARRAAGQAKTTGGDVLARQLAERAGTLCR